MAQRTAVKKAKLGHSKQVEKPVESPSEGESENSVSESESDLENDELDVVQDDSDGVEDDEEDVNEDESDQESDESEDEDSKDSRPVRDDGFGSAMSAILGSKVKAHDASNPILIRNKRSAREIDEAREEKKARRAIRAEKLQHQDKARVRDVIPKDPEEAGDVLSNEKKLRKTAQRGVVRLLNAIHSAQSAAIQGITDPHDKHAAEANAEVSKEKFLDMIRMG